jgi:hypothetical protein
MPESSYVAAADSRKRAPSAAVWKRMTEGARVTGSSDVDDACFMYGDMTNVDGSVYQDGRC